MTAKRKWCTDFGHEWGKRGGVRRVCSTCGKVQYRNYISGNWKNETPEQRERWEKWNQKRQNKGVVS